MRNWILILVFLAPLAACAQNTSTQLKENAVLIKSIEIDGFILGDKSQFTQLFKPFRNKYLSSDDIEDLLKRIQNIYEREGYLELVSINYKVDKHRLIFTVLMTA